MAEDLEPVPTKDELRRRHKLSRADAEIMHAKLVKERNTELALRRDAEIRKTEVETKASQQKSDAKLAEKRLEEEAKDRDAKRAADEWNRSGTKYAMDVGEEFGIPVVGYGAGHAIGHTLDKGARSWTADRSRKLAELMAGTRGYNVTNPDDVLNARAKVAAADKMRLDRGPGVARRAGPYGAGLALALMGAGTRAMAPKDDQGKPSGIVDAAGRAEMAAGLGTMVHEGITSLRRPGMDAKPVGDLERARIIAEGPGVQPVAPQPDPVPDAVAKPVPMKPDYGAMSHNERQAAYRQMFGTRTAPRVTSDELRRALEIGKPISKPPVSSALLAALLPASVAASVYDSMTSPASAADGDSPDGVTWADRGTAAAAASGAGGAAYGAQKAAGWLGGKIGQAASYIPGASTAGAVASRALPWALPAQVALSSGDTQSPHDDSEAGRAAALRANRSLTAADLSPEEAVNEMAYQLQARPADRAALVRALLGASTYYPPNNADTMTAAEMGAF